MSASIEAIEQEIETDEYWDLGAASRESNVGGVFPGKPLRSFRWSHYTQIRHIVSIFMDAPATYFGFAGPSRC